MSSWVATVRPRCQPGGHASSPSRPLGGLSEGTSHACPWSFTSSLHTSAPADCQLNTTQHAEPPSHGEAPSESSGGLSTGKSHARPLDLHKQPAHISTSSLPAEQHAP